MKLKPLIPFIAAAVAAVGMGIIDPPVLPKAQFNEIAQRGDHIIFRR